MTSSKKADDKQLKERRLVNSNQMKNKAVNLGQQKGKNQSTSQRAGKLK